MAEAIILPFAKSILKNIASFTADIATEEFKGLESLTEDLKAIAKDLESIIAVLHDAEAKQCTNPAIKNWLRDLKSVVYDIDDLLDDAATDALQRRVNKDDFFPEHGYCISFQPFSLCSDLSRKLKELRLGLENIVAKRTKLGLTDRPIEIQRVERDDFDVCGYVNKLVTVGRDNAKNDIITTIMGLGDDCSLSVLPILGTGGIGKTELARLISYSISEYDTNLWACVSDKFDLHKILSIVLKDATTEHTANLSLRRLVRRLQSFLTGKKYFLVLDDVWEDDITSWMELKSILDVGRSGSVILITTRVEKVASMTQTVPPYKLDKLSDADCWGIFEKLAFVDGEEKRYLRLYEIGMSIVKNCCGIPLAVQSLGALLRTERNEEEWLRIENSYTLNQSDGRHNIVKESLKLSYEKLPSHLKSCYAHLSLFPKDFLHYSDLISDYWSALGLLELRGTSASNYKVFNEFLSRFMIKEAGLDLGDRISIFKMPNYMHDLAKDVLGEELFVMTRNKQRSVPDSARYIAWEICDLLDEDFQEFPEEINAKKARAFMLHQIPLRNMSQSFLEGIISNMPYLRILNLSGCHFDELPCSIRNLRHLRLLHLTHNHLIKSLPNALCELLNLECLHLAGCIQTRKITIKDIQAHKFEIASLND